MILSHVAGSCKGPIALNFGNICSSSKEVHVFFFAYIMAVLLTITRQLLFTRLSRFLRKCQVNDIKLS